MHALHGHVPLRYAFTISIGSNPLTTKSGNGRLDLGETCDWSMNAFESCCAMNCTGCLCGNGRLDAGEQCDFGIPDQIGCCNASCQGARLIGVLCAMCVCTSECMPSDAQV